MRLWPRLTLAVLLGLTACRSHLAPAPVGAGDALEPLSLERLQRDTFRYFWHTTDRATGLAPDRYPSASPASIAAIGFALSAYAVGVERGYISRAEARERTRLTLDYLWQRPMGRAAGAASHLCPLRRTSLRRVRLSRRL